MDKCILKAFHLIPFFLLKFEKNVQKKFQHGKKIVSVFQSTTDILYKIQNERKKIYNFLFNRMKLLFDVQLLKICLLSVGLNACVYVCIFVYVVCAVPHGLTIIFNTRSRLQNAN